MTSWCGCLELVAGVVVSNGFEFSMMVTSNGENTVYAISRCYSQ